MNLDYKGTSVFYDVIGEGETIVFLHGFLENSTMWKEITQELKSDFQVIIIDLPGHGNTGNYGETHSMEMMAAVVKHILQHLKVNAATIVGHSMGGYVALALAEADPNYFRGLILMNSSALDDNRERKENRDRAIKLIKKDKDLFISMSINNLFAAENREIFIKEIEDLKQQAYEMTTENIIAAIRGMKIRKNRVDVLNSLKCKKLVVLGLKDEVLTLQDQRNYLNDKNIRIQVLEGGHMSQIENNKELTYLLKHFNEK
ncbi:Pimeloyl-ACP methyl ester carboxylesterase [Flavobacteriaceae bacterium MAR_2010_188]|nr:Pimeloyl-ACP methyl ester carboxylesterase [Flavobacteriaceae bacterium MAR_2010_188]